MIAEQLTLMDWDLFLNVHCDEFHTHISHPNPESPLSKAIAHTNTVCLWVVSMILDKPLVAGQVEVMVRFIEVCKVCYTVKHIYTH